MKLNFLIPVISLLLIFTSCKKTEFNPSPANMDLSVKINTWLNGKKIEGMRIKNNTIESLQLNILQNEIVIEQLNDFEKLIIAPLKENVVFAYHKDEQTVNALLFIVDKNGDIRKGNIVQYVPTDKGIHKIPGNSFHNFYNSKRVQLDGTLTFLTIGGNFLEEYSYENSQVSSYKFLKKESENNSSTRTVCTQWWLVTTTYYSDGTTEVDITDLGVTCYEDGDCVPNELCDHITDGGGSSAPPEDPQDWVEKSWSITNDYWAVNSTEKIKGIRNASYTNGGYFNGAAHVSDNFVHVSTGNFTLSNKSVEVSHSYLTVLSKIYGIVTWTDPSPQVFSYILPPNNSNSWSFSQVYP
jgi:hypothetical protein